MTLQELSQYFKLREQLARDEEILESLKATACPGAQVLTGMPHAPGVRDKVGDLAVEIADMESQIEYLQEKISQEEAKVSVFISTIENDQARMERGCSRHRREEYGERRQEPVLPLPRNLQRRDAP